MFKLTGERGLKPMILGVFKKSEKSYPRHFLGHVLDTVLSKSKCLKSGQNEGF